MTHFALLKFYGIDWAAMVLMFSSIYALGRKFRYGFVLGAGGCVFWILFGFITGSLADITANAACFVMNLIGFARWSNACPVKECSR
jgi:hypothetical protein